MTSSVKKLAGSCPDQTRQQESCQAALFVKEAAAMDRGQRCAGENIPVERRGETVLMGGSSMDYNGAMEGSGGHHVGDSPSVES